MNQGQSILERIQHYYDSVDNSKSATKDGVTTDHYALQEISTLFSDNAVYERDGDKPFIGKEAISEFFGKKRPLVGGHAIESIESKAGIDEVEYLIKRRFPAVKAADCVTISVKGIFTGAQLSKDNNGMIDYALGTPLPFEDYWVVANDKVIYRHSIINRDQALGRA
jgi:hypothetical protein